MSIDKFIAAMNQKAADLGLSRTVFKNANGFFASGQTVSARNMLKMIIEATKYQEICNVWGASTYTVNIQGLNPRSIEIQSSFMLEPTLPTSRYAFIGGKTGTLTGTKGIRNFQCVARPSGGGDTYAAVIVNATYSSRYTAMGQLLDLAVAGIADGASVGATACVAAVTDNNGNQIGGFLGIKNLDDRYQPASTVKTMAYMVMLDYIKNLDATLTLISSDIVGGSGPDMYAGDVITFKDALYLGFLPSSNSTMKAVARVVGEGY